MGYITGRPPIPESRINEAARLVNEGVTVSDAARVTGVSRQTLTRRRVLKRSASADGVDWIDLYKHLVADWKDTHQQAQKAITRLSNLLNVMELAEREHAGPVALEVNDLFKSVRSLQRRLASRTKE